MVNNKGFLRTLEAVVAIIIILALIIYLAPSKKLETGVPSNVKEAKEFILKEILTNTTLRECMNIIGDCKPACENRLKSFLDNNIPFGYDYGCEICTASNQGCADLKVLQEKKNIYSGVIYLNFDKTFRLFLYEK